MQATFAYLMKEISDKSNAGEYPSIAPSQWQLIESEPEQLLYAFTRHMLFQLICNELLDRPKEGC